MIVQRGLADFLSDGLRISAELGETLRANEGLKVEGFKLVARAADAMSLGPLLDELGARITVRQNLVSIQLDSGKLVALLAYGGTEVEGTITIDIAVQMRRRGHELKLIYAAPEARPAMRDDCLIQLLGHLPSHIADLPRSGDGHLADGDGSWLRREWRPPVPRCVP